MATVSFEEIVELVDGLSSAEQTQLTTYLLESARKRQLSVEEKMHLLRSVQISAEVNQEPSVRREDWYGDDGR